MVTVGGIVTYLIGFIATIVGVVLFTTIPKQMGLYRALAKSYPFSTGLTPAHSYNIPYGFTIDELYQLNLTGQTAIVTGANAGIGYSITEVLHELGADVTMACRNITKCNIAAESIRSKRSHTNGPTIATMLLDTNSLASVRTFCLDYVNHRTPGSLDMLFLNAGSVGYIDKVNKKCVPTNDDGIETTFATNYVGHHLLYRYVEPLLQKSKTARVVSTASAASFTTYSYKVATNRTTLNGCIEPYTDMMGNHYSYGQSKLAQILWTKHLSTRLEPKSNIYVNAFHPGAVSTEIFDKALKMVQAPQFLVSIAEWLQREALWTPLEGALTGLYLGANAHTIVEKDIRGQYYHPQTVPIDNPFARDRTLQQQLWDFSEELVKDFLPANDPVN
jgi:NAD(P)-dependent dehydrogenase (short-subunit alcohol dehydrogenase family)